MFFNLTIPDLIARVVVLLTAFSVHEFAHAWTADRYGDLTPRSNGRLTLNPLAHLDPIGSLMLLLVGFGWAKPVPINPYAIQRRSPAGVMWVSLAGPLSNFLMAVLAAIPFRLGLVSQFRAVAAPGQILPTIDLVLYQFIFINLILMLFNLIPLSPLDGEKVFDYLLPPSFGQFMDRIRPYGPLILMALIFIVPYFLHFDLLGAILGPPMRALIRLLIG